MHPGLAGMYSILMWVTWMQLVKIKFEVALGRFVKPHIWLYQHVEELHQILILEQPMRDDPLY